MNNEKKARQRLFRSVRHEGGSTVLTIGKDVLPNNWQIVSISVLSSDLSAERPSVCLKIERVS